MIESDATPRMPQLPSSYDPKLHNSHDILRKSSSIPTAEAKSSPSADQPDTEALKISAYARLDFENYTFFVQTLQVVLGRKALEDASLSHHSVDVHLSSKKAISRRHAKIFYNFGTQRFEISILGRNGAFVDNLFVETGITVPLVDNTKIQIGDIPFTFVLPSLEPLETSNKKSGNATPFNPSDAINLRSNLYLNPNSPNKKKPLSEEQKKARRDLKANLVRRLSNARRKSLASSTNDEITALLKELEDIGDEEEIDSIDEEVNNLLRQGNLEKEEDEIDELVKQHNLLQGVILEDKHKLDDVDMSVLDQEIASLAPLIDQQNEKDHTYGNNQGLQAKQGTLPHDSSEHRAPLMGRPVGPRMGKPAQIQPPANRAYGRQPVGQIYGVPTTGPYTTTYNAPYGTLPSYAPAGRAGMYHPMMMPARPPPPKLEVEVEVIDAVPVKNPLDVFKAITTGVGIIKRPPICVFKTLDPPLGKPKIPLRRRDAPTIKKPKSNTNKDIPEQYKSKPAVNISAMLASVLRGPNSRKSGFTIAEILEGIKELYPYYQYCPDGWQAAITHVLKTHKMFKREFKAGLDSEHLWVVDEEFLTEKEKVRKKQQEVAMAKAKEAALKAVELRLKQLTTQYGTVGRPFMTPYTSTFAQPRYPVSLGLPTMQSPPPGQKPKSIAELASQIKRDSPGVSTLPSYSPPPSASPQTAGSLESSNSIKDQLAANRSSSPPQAMGTERASTPQPVATASAVSAATSSSTVSKQLPMNAETKKSLTYLQKELFTLYKARKLSYNTATTTNIITKALATTIAQVNTIGAKAGCGDNALSFLVEKAPQQVSKILDIALTKSIKEIEGKLSNPSSREPTPVASVASPIAKGEKNLKSEEESISRPATPSSSGGTPKPSYSGGLSRPHFSGMARQQNNSKPGALLNGPLFLSNKPRQEKRPMEESNADSSKYIKLE